MQLCMYHGGGARCTHSDGCTKGAVGGVFCIRHGGGKRCSYNECDKSVLRQSAYCSYHKQYVERLKLGGNIGIKKSNNIQYKTQNQHKDEISNSEKMNNRTLASNKSNESFKFGSHNMNEKINQPGSTNSSSSSPFKNKDSSSLQYSNLFYADPRYSATLSASSAGSSLSNVQEIVNDTQIKTITNPLIKMNAQTQSNHMPKHYQHQMMYSAPIQQYSQNINQLPFMGLYNYPTQYYPGANNYHQHYLMHQTILTQPNRSNNTIHQHPNIPTINDGRFNNISKGI